MTIFPQTDPCCDFWNITIHHFPEKSNADFFSFSCNALKDGTEKIKKKDALMFVIEKNGVDTINMFVQVWIDGCPHRIKYEINTFTPC